MSRLYRKPRRRGPPLTKSEQMGRVRQTGTKPEHVLGSALWKAGLRYRLSSRLPGRPDLIFIRARVAVFVDGCFWHGCPLHGTRPAARRAYWEPKLARNRERDRLADEALRALGWTSLRFWEHEVAGSLDAVVMTIAWALQADRHT